MFFVVFLIEPAKNVVVPTGWILNGKQHMEKFINYGINSNQDFLAFYTNDAAAFDINGVPRSDYQPNYQPNTFAGFGSVYPTEGWYLCRIIKFKGE